MMVVILHAQIVQVYPMVLMKLTNVENVMMILPTIVYRIVMVNGVVVL